MPSFDDLVGQRRSTSILQSFLKKKSYPQALLFEGERGVGKRLAAEIFAQMVLCDAPLIDAGAPCGHCLPCQKIQNRNHPDFMPIAPEGNAIKIDQVREMQQRIIYKPASGLKKIIFIDPAEKMNPAAANGLLKTLEEPPPYALLILISAEGGSLLPTMRSRCQIVPFHPLSFSQVRKVIMQEKGYTEMDAHLVAATAFGRLGMARTLEIEAARQMDEQRYVLIECADFFETAANFSQDRETLEDALQYLMHWFRDVLLVKSLNEEKNVSDINLYFPWRHTAIKAWAEQMTSSEIHDLWEDMQRVLAAQNRNVNRPLSLETLLMRMRKNPFSQ